MEKIKEGKRIREKKKYIKEREGEGEIKRKGANWNGPLYHSPMRLWEVRYCQRNLKSIPNWDKIKTSIK